MSGRPFRAGALLHSTERHGGRRIVDIGLASEAVALRLTKHLAVELRPVRISANSVSAEQTPTGICGCNEPRDRITPTTVTGEAIPLGRRDQLADNVGVILFLASLPAGFITGIDVPVEGRVLA